MPLFFSKSRQLTDDSVFWFLKICEIGLVLVLKSVFFGLFLTHLTSVGSYFGLCYKFSEFRLVWFYDLYLKDWKKLVGFLFWFLRKGKKKLVGITGSL